MDEVIRDFLIESHEGLDQLDKDLLSLEKDPTDSETLKRVFRTIHTIKGTCGFFGFSKLESIAHVGESLLHLLRDKKLLLNPEIATSLLAMVDAFREILSKIETDQTEGDADFTTLISLLNRLQCNEESEAGLKSAELYGTSADLPLDNLGGIFIRKGQATAAEVEAAARQQQTGDPRRLGEILVEPGAVKPQEVVAALKEQAETRSAVTESNIRVDVRLLDQLMNLVGELVQARNQVLQYTVTQQDSAFAATSQRLSLITTELQEGVMKTRMQPIGNVWSKFPRVVRDLALVCGKQIRVEMEGTETELDKIIIESIKDPLTHIVRNSADHGIETPEVRVAKGKPAEGCLRLRAFHEGGQVNIEISDDGNGVDGKKVKAKALQQGLITAEQAALMSELEMVNLIFLPGFSTADKLTNVSGRGVGMDVVKTNIEKIGGTVDVQSKLGQGTTLKIKIPLRESHPQSAVAIHRDMLQQEIIPPSF
jgi:two-component system, chemotaxis family, sensor kinase CheA